MERTTIKSLATEYGKENLLFIIPKHPRSFIGFKGVGLWHEEKDAEKIPVPYKIEERWNREVENEYKLVLVPIKPYGEMFGEEDFYVMDLQDIIRRGYIQLYVTPKLKWPLSNEVEES